jgi:hypothetical protein
VPRYFFHLYDDMVAMDDEGRTLPDIDFARGVAVTEAREIMTETVLKGRLNLSHRVEIADEDGVVLDSVKFRDAVAVTE